MHTVVEVNDMRLFWRSLEIMGDLSAQSSDFRNAVNAYNKMRYVGEYTENNELRVRALIHLSDTCKLMHKYSVSRRFLKKALQYVWFGDKND